MIRIPSNEIILKKLEKLALPKKIQVAAGSPKDALKYMNFTGQQVVATNTHWLGLLKDYKSIPHIGTAQGGLPPEDLRYPDYHQVIPKETSWEVTWPLGTEFLAHLLPLLVGAEKALKDKDSTTADLIVLRKQGGNLDAYMTYPGSIIKVGMLRELSASEDFDGGYHLPNFIRAIDFLLSASGATNLKMSIGKHRHNAQVGPLLMFETDKAFVLGSPVRNATVPDSIVRL